MPEVSPVPSLPGRSLGQADVAAEVEHADVERVLKRGVAAHGEQGVGGVNGAGHPGHGVAAEGEGPVFWRDWKIRMPAYVPEVGADRLKRPSPLRVMPPKVPPVLG